MRLKICPGELDLFPSPHGFVGCVTDALPARYRSVLSYKNHGFARCGPDALPARYRPVPQKPRFREVRYRRVTGALITLASHKNHGFVRCVTDALPARYRPVPLFVGRYRHTPYAVYKIKKREGWGP